MPDEYETLLEMARQAQRAAAHLWHWREISAREYAEARALYAGAEALRREKEQDAMQTEVRAARRRLGITDE